MCPAALVRVDFYSSSRNIAVAMLQVEHLNSNARKPYKPHQTSNASSAEHSTPSLSNQHPSWHKLGYNNNQNRLNVSLPVPLGNRQQSSHDLHQVQGLARRCCPTLQRNSTNGHQNSKMLMWMLMSSSGAGKAANS